MQSIMRHCKASKIERTMSKRGTDGKKIGERKVETGEIWRGKKMKWKNEGKHESDLSPGRDPVDGASVRCLVWG